MDYEEAFKDAYKRASLRFGTNVANELFLEYKESKEERIRRGLIEYFYDWSKSKSYCWGIPVTDIISFLEKQGEQKPYGQRKECLDCQFNYAGECKGSCAIKRGEQKSALDIEIPFGAKDSKLQEATYLIPEGFHAEIKDNEVLIKKGKQKPAWAESDDEELEIAINALKGAGQYDSAAWLLTLKQRIGG